MAAYDIIYHKAEEIKEVLANEEKKKEILKTIKENNLTKEDIKKNTSKKDEKNKPKDNILTDENALALKEWEAILENDRKNAPKINQIHQKKNEPNWNDKDDDEEVKSTKKNIIEAIKEKRKKKIKKFWI